MVDEYSQKLELALQDVENLEGDDLIKFSSGVVLKQKRVNILRIQAILDQFRYPDPPVIYDKEREKAYTNPDHPVYLEKKQQIDMQRTLAVIDAIVTLGTEIKECPDTVSKIEDQDWIEELKVINIEVNAESKLLRYLAWVKYVAIVSNEDVELLASKAGMSLGTSEGKISEQIRNNFPDNP